MILAGQSVTAVMVSGAAASRVMVGGVEAWSGSRPVVAITGRSGYESRDQLRTALTERGLDYQTVTELPFDLDTSQAASLQELFRDMAALVSVPYMDTSGVVSMYMMFRDCTALTHVGDLQTSNVVAAGAMFFNCSALMDGSVRLLGKHPSVTTANMIYGAGLTAEPWFQADGTPFPKSETHQVTLTHKTGTGTEHPLVDVTVPTGQTWQVHIQGTVTEAAASGASWPRFKIGSVLSDVFGKPTPVDYSGTITSTNSTIAMVTSAAVVNTSFTGTVTITKP